MVEAVKPMDMNVLHHDIAVQISQTDKEEVCSLNILAEGRNQLSKRTRPLFKTQVDLVKTIGSKGKQSHGF